MSSVLEGLFRVAFRGRLRRFAGIPGPAPRFPFGNLLDFVGRQPWEVLADYGREYGGMSLTWAFGTPVVVLNDPGLIGDVLDRNHADYYKDAPGAALAPVILPQCLFISNGPAWARRRAAHPMSLPDLDAWLDAQVPVLRAELEAGVDQLVARSATGPIDLTDAVLRLTFRAFARVTWGEPFDDADFDRFMYLGGVGDRRMKNPLLALLPPLAPRFWAERRAWYDRFDRLIAAAQNPAPHRTDLLATMVRRGSPPSPDEFRALMANIFYGGAYSASSCLATTLYLLAQRPELEAALRAECAALGVADRAALDAAPLLDGVVRESLRFLTPVPAYGRNVATTRSTVLGGHTLPPDTIVVVTNWLLHRSADYWTNPDQYDPHRWTSGAAADAAERGYFFPFGRGPRRCVGMRFALFYLKLAAAAVYSRVRVEPEPGVAYKQAYFFGVMAPRDLRARFTRP
ncbi:cytochrome P450 [bacterium]|nr:cytochrome P450 [bacterium]